MSPFARDLFLMVVMIGIFMGGFWLGFEAEKPLPPAQELKAYRHCMQQTATSCGCRMTTKDFIRYYELINQLENNNDEEKACEKDGTATENQET